MLVVVIFQRFLGHMGRKGVIGVRKGGKRKGHGGCPTMMGDVGFNGNPYRRFQRS
jgi:hypothetical protein